MTDIDDLTSDNHRPEDQDPEAASDTPAVPRWNGEAAGTPISTESPF